MLPFRTPGAVVGVLAVVLFSFATRAVADSFTAYNVQGSSGGDDNVGLTTGGTLVVNLGVTGNFLVFTPPSTRVVVSGAPALTYDDGTACAITGTGAYMHASSTGVCNNGFEVFTATTDGIHTELFDGPDPTMDLVYDSSADSILLNSVGDVAIVSLVNPDPSLDDENILLIRSATGVTPEPWSLALVGTGFLCVAVGARSRRRAAV